MIQRKSVGHLVASESTSSNLWDHCHPSRSRRSAHLHKQMEADEFVNVQLNLIRRNDISEDLNGGKLKMSIAGDPVNSEGYTNIFVVALACLYLKTMSIDGSTVDVIRNLFMVLIRPFWSKSHLLKDPLIV